MVEAARKEVHAALSAKNSLLEKSFIAPVVDSLSTKYSLTFHELPKIAPAPTLWLLQLPSHRPPTTPSITSSSAGPSLAWFSISLPFCLTCLSYRPCPLLRSGLVMFWSRFEPTSEGRESPVPVTTSAVGAVSLVV